MDNAGIRHDARYTDFGGWVWIEPLAVPFFYHVATEACFMAEVFDLFYVASLNHEDCFMRSECLDS